MFTSTGLQFQIYVCVFFDLVYAFETGTIFDHFLGIFRAISGQFLGQILGMFLDLNFGTFVLGHFFWAFFLDTNYCAFFWIFFAHIPRLHIRGKIAKLVFKKITPKKLSQKNCPQNKVQKMFKIGVHKIGVQKKCPQKIVPKLRSKKLPKNYPKNPQKKSPEKMPAVEETS